MGRSASLGVVVVLLAQVLGCASRLDGPEARAKARQLFDRTVLAAKNAGPAGTSVLARLAVLKGERFGLTDGERRQLLKSAWETDTPSPEAAFAAAQLEDCDRAWARMGRGSPGGLYVATGCQTLIDNEFRDALGRGDADSFVEAGGPFALLPAERRRQLLTFMAKAVAAKGAGPVYMQARLAGLLADFGDAQGAYAMALQALGTMKKFYTFGEHPWLYDTLGRVLVPAGESHRFVEVVKAKYVSARIHVAVALLVAKAAPEGADALVAEVEHADPVGRAAVHLARGRRAEGEALLRATLAAKGNKELERMGAVAAAHGLHGVLGERLARRDAYVRSAWHGGAAEALLEAGKLKQAEAQMALMVGSPARSRLQLALAEAYAAKGEEVAARRWLREALREAGPAEGVAIAATARAWGRWFLALVAVAVARRDPVAHAQGLLELVLLTEKQGVPVDPVERAWEAALR